MGKKILFDSNKKAACVIVSTASVSYTLTATREFIVSAGAFQSPQLLMVSGVGPAAQLQKYSIPVVKDLPGVGQGMQDHIFFGPSSRVKVETFTKLANDPLYVLSEFAINYSVLKRGPLTNPVCDFLGWEKVPANLRNSFPQSAKDDLAQFPADWPEVEYLSAPGFVGDFPNLWLNQPKDGYQYATIMAALVAPLSRGTVTIVSADTNTKPLINMLVAHAVWVQRVTRWPWLTARQKYMVSKDYASSMPAPLHYCLRAILRAPYTLLPRRLRPTFWPVYKSLKMSVAQSTMKPSESCQGVLCREARLRISNSFIYF
jgi:choline dehydrogenase-like flavoprotein